MVPPAVRSLVFLLQDPVKNQLKADVPQSLERKRAQLLRLKGTVHLLQTPAVVLFVVDASRGAVVVLALFPVAP